MKKAYDLLFEPILNGAREQGVIRQVPEADQLIEMAHVLPGRAGASRPVIVRFRARWMKSLCFRFRRDYAPTATVNGDPEKQRQVYPFFDDLTRATAKKMSEIQAAPRVQSCWSLNGQLRYKLKDSQDVKKVRSVFDSIDTILG